MSTFGAPSLRPYDGSDVPGMSALSSLGGTAVGPAGAGAGGLFAYGGPGTVAASSSSGGPLGGLDGAPLGGAVFGGLGGGLGGGPGGAPSSSSGEDYHMDLNLASTLGGLDLGLNMDDNDPLLRAIGGLTSRYPPPPPLPSSCLAP